jgi:hypothetical protein
MVSVSQSGIVHNFIRIHFTTKKVPAVALGIVERGLSWEQVLMLQTNRPLMGII